MRKAHWELGLLILAVAGMHAVRANKTGTIKGKVFPAGKSESIMAINGRDSVRSASTDGYFGMKVKPGVWKVIISDKEQVKNVVRENLWVNEGQNVNLGVIRVSEQNN